MIWNSALIGLPCWVPPPEKQEEENSGDEYVKFDINVDSGLAGPDRAWATCLVWVMHFEL